MGAVLSVKVSRKTPDKRRIIYVPRYIAELVPEGTNVISIEWLEQDRPMFRSNVNVYPILGSEEKGEIGLDQWIDELNGANIVVHCEMGMVRSRNMAQNIVNSHGYRMMESVMVMDTEGREFQYRPSRLFS